MNNIVHVSHTLFKTQFRIGSFLTMFLSNHMKNMNNVCLSEWTCYRICHVNICCYLIKYAFAKLLVHILSPEMLPAHIVCHQQLPHKALTLRHRPTAEASKIPSICYTSKWWVYWKPPLCKKLRTHSNISHFNSHSIESQTCIMKIVLSICYLENLLLFINCKNKNIYAFIYFKLFKHIFGSQTG